MKKTLRLAALAGVLGLSFLSLQARAVPPGVYPIPYGCRDGSPCSVEADCGFFESGAPAGGCAYDHTCICR
jgi:hypothetical protein